jgi:hypothetical protein
MGVKPAQSICAILLLPWLIVGCRLGRLIAPGSSDEAARVQAPSDLVQFEGDGTTLVAVGAVVREAVVVVGASIPAVSTGDTLRLEVELRPVGLSFLGEATQKSGPLEPATVAAFAVSGLADDTGYHWQLRLVNGREASEWVPFGDNAETDPDFWVAVPQVPDPPAELGQFRSDGETPIPVGGSSNGSRVVLRATLSDPDPGDTLRLEVEVRPTGTAFRDAATHSAPGLVSGERGSVEVEAALLTGYHWQARTCDRERCTAWVSFGNNPEDEDDFVGDPLSASRSRTR